jgi:hypothetical protein
MNATGLKTLWVCCFPAVSYSLVKSLFDQSNSLQNVTRRVEDKLKLGRLGLVSSYLEGLFSEPNTGPFPQYNVLFEDEPIDEFASQAAKTTRKYQSAAHDHLARLLRNSTKELIKLEKWLYNPRTLAAKSIISKASASSFLQDYEQFVPENTAPYQEIVIHEQSRPVDGGDAPVTPRSSPRYLDVNRTSDLIELKLLAAEEIRMLKQLERLAGSLPRPSTDE